MEKKWKIKKDVKVEKKDEKLDAEKVQEIVKKAKAKGKITYEELAKELENTNPDQIDKVFDAFEEMGVNILNDDFEDEPDIDDLKEVENLTRYPAQILPYNCRTQAHSLHSLLSSQKMASSHTWST